MDENKDLQPEKDEEETVTAQEDGEEAVETEPVADEPEEETEDQPEEDTQEDAQEQKDSENKSAKRSPKKKAAIIAAIASVLVIALAVIVGVFSSSSPESVLKKAVGCIEAGEYAKVIEYTSATQFFPLDKLTDVPDETKAEYIRNKVCASFIEKIEAGSKLSIEITEVKDLTQEEIALIKDVFTIEETDGAEAKTVNIEEMKSVTFSWVVEQTGEKHEDSVHLIKEDGEWLIRW